MSLTGEQGTDARPSATDGLIQMYLARGWPLLVCKPRGKEPLTPHGVADATTNPEVIAGWRKRWPHANWAVACGAPGPQVLDIDNPEAVPVAVVRAIMNAPRVASARGGHAYFAGTEAGKVELGYGHLLGRGNYVMLPPSTHPSGSMYRWVAEPRGALPPAPALTPPRRERPTGRPDVKVPRGQWHPALVSLLGLMRRWGACEQVLDAAAVALAQHQFLHDGGPIDWDHVHKTAADIARRY